MSVDEKYRDILAHVEAILGSRPVKFRSASGGYSPALRLVVECENGARCFVKGAVDDLTAEWLRIEHKVYLSIKGDFMPEFVGWHDDGVAPLLIIEDLSDGVWSHKWDEQSISAVRAVLAAVQKTTPPENLPTVESMREYFVSWHLVAEDPEPFLALGLCTREWLTAALPTLIAADNAAILDGTDLLHLDVRSDNICFIDGRVLLVDWNWACTGNALLELTFWLPSVALEGGPQPEEIIEGDPSIVALAAGFWAHRAGLPPPGPGSKVREIQLKQLKIAFPWCVKLLGLPAPL